jgi:hypothetical protein
MPVCEVINHQGHQGFTKEELKTVKKEDHSIRGLGYLAVSEGHCACQGAQLESSVPCSCLQEVAARVGWGGIGFQPCPSRSRI